MRQVQRRLLDDSGNIKAEKVKLPLSGMTRVPAFVLLGLLSSCSDEEVPLGSSPNSGPTLDEFLRDSGVVTVSSKSEHVVNPAGAKKYERERREASVAFLAELEECAEKGSSIKIFRGETLAEAKKTLLEKLGFGQPSVEGGVHLIPSESGTSKLLLTAGDSTDLLKACLIGIGNFVEFVHGISIESSTTEGGQVSSGNVYGYAFRKSVDFRKTTKSEKDSITATVTTFNTGYSVSHPNGVFIAKFQYETIHDSDKSSFDGSRLVEESGLSPKTFIRDITDPEKKGFRLYVAVAEPEGDYATYWLFPKSLKNNAPESP